VRAIVARGLSLVLALGLASCGGSDPPVRTTATADPLRIGTKNFPEAVLLGELYKQALEARGIPVRLRPGVGSSEVIHKALENDALDMYPEYIGVLLSEVDKVLKRPASAADSYALAKMKEEARKLTLLEPTSLSDENALAVTKAFARRHDVSSIADLRRVRPRPTLRAAPEFQSRFEGQLGLRRLYGLKLKLKPWNTAGVQYAELDRGKYGVALVFTTDPQLASGRYVLLRDPKSVFAKNHVAPLISQKAVKRYGPRMTERLNAVSGLLTTPVMRGLNAKLVEGQSPKQVADEFLRAHNLKAASPSP